MILPKKDDKKEALKAKFGVTKDIPKQQVQEEVVKQEKQNVQEGDTNPLSLLLRIEKLEGKFSAFEDVKDDINERIARISEEIGELRSSFLELDKNFTSLESRVEKVLDSVNQIQPEKFYKDLQKKEADILKLQAESESLKNVLASIKKDNERLNSILEKIKNIENLVAMYKKLSEKIQLIDDTKLYVDRLAGKSETIFSEMESKMKDVEDMKGKIQKLDDLTVDIVKMLDGISIKIPKLIEKENVEKLIEEMTKKNIENVNKNYLGEIKKIIELSKQEAKKEIDDEKKRLTNTLNEITSLLNSVKSDLSSKTNLKIDQKSDLYFKFLQAVDVLKILSTKEEIQTQIDFIKSLRNRLIELNSWTNDSENYLLRNLYYLSYIWEQYGNDEIKSLVEQQISLIARRS
ncbi:MAG: hypothetical protein QXM68_01590 [Candidatus Aenigmatarchaeota archaeon]|nr:hypothetical protein [Candidatus Aenigmarchaeota archaeon]